jgi:hypothetical protein
MTTIIQQPKLLNYKNLSIDKYEYQLPYKTQNGYYQSVCNYRLTKNQVLPFYFETPKLKTTSGIVRVDDKFYLDLELTQTGESGSFYNFLIKNDENNISVCHTNSKDWFKQSMPLNIIEKYYKSPVIRKTNGQLPIVRLRIPSYKGNILTEIYNIRKEKLNNLTSIQEGDSLIGILEFSGMMFLSQNFTPCYELHKIKVFKDNDNRLLSSGYLFSDMNDTIDLTSNLVKDKVLEDEIINNTPPPLAVSNTPNKIINNQNNAITSNIAIENKNTKTQIEQEPKKIKTIFDLIKETTINDIMFDESLFNNNNKQFINNINNTKQLYQEKNEESLEEEIDDGGLEEALEEENEEDLEEDGLDEDSLYEENEDMNKDEIEDTPNIKIQDIDNVNLNIDYELSQLNSNTSINSIKYEEELQKILDNQSDDENGDENGDENEDENKDEEDDEDENENENENKDEDDEDDEEDEDEDDEEDDEEDEDEEAEDEEDNGIDFDTLNDLEVMIFDE